MNISRFLSFQLFFFTFFKLNFLYAAEPLPFNNIVLHKNPLQVSQVKLKDFYLKDIEVNKNDGKIKILNFWATWCDPCRKEMPSLDNLDAKNLEISIYPVNLEKPNMAKTKKFFEDLKIKNLKIYYESSIKLANNFSLVGLPTTILINKNGEEFARILGSIDFENEDFIEWLSNYN